MNIERTFQIRVLTSLEKVDPSEWDRLAGEENPFLCHAFLLALEKSGSACAETGWLGQHLLLEDDQGQLMGAMPCYLKNHSQGEYVFDHGWADAFMRAGGDYYPKLQCSVPFTPASGARFLVGDADQPEFIIAALMDGLKQLAEKLRASSAHITFMNREEWELAGKFGFLQREDRQFHWQNDGYESFEQFLETLSSRKRKNIRKERKQAQNIEGLEIVHLRAKDIDQEAIDAFYQFYMDTGSRKWGRPYLTKEFFEHTRDTMGEKTLFIMARRNARYVAGAINFIGSNCIYGRHWGCIENHPFLHFEICYYQAIEFAIQNGLRTVEAGAQGEHKLARGYVPVSTYSAHHIAHSGFEDAIKDYLEREREHVRMEKNILEQHTPFKKEQ